MVPVNDPKWQLLLNLLDVLFYVTAPSLPEADIEVIHEFISDFLESFTREFPEQHIKPKAHFLIHYPDQIKLFGPLVNVWTLRFEGEHNYFKEIYATTNRKKYAKHWQRDIRCYSVY